MQNEAMAAKRKIEYDGEEVPGLVFSGELRLAQGSIEVPGFDKIIPIGNGVTTIPVWEVRYKTERGTNTKAFFRDWAQNNEIKDVTVINTDGHGVEIDRITLPDCECLEWVPIQESDSSSPPYAMIMAVIAPADVIPIEVE